MVGSLNFLGEKMHAAVRQTHHLRAAVCGECLDHPENIILLAMEHLPQFLLVANDCGS